MKKKLLEQAKVLPGINPAALSAGDTNGIVINRFGYLSAVVNLAVGAASGTPTAQGVSLKVQHGDASDGSDMADVSGATIAALDADNTNASLELDLAGYKQYIRVVTTTTFTGGTSPDIPVAVAVTLGDATEEPVT